MEAVRDFMTCEDADRGSASVQESGVVGVDGVAGVEVALAVLQAVSAAAVEDAGSWGFRAASDFAGRMEEISRTVEHLQLVGAAAVDRTRKQSAAAGVAAGAATSWTTGWREGPGGWETGGPGGAVPAGTAAGGAAELAAAAGASSATAETAADASSVSTAAAADASSATAAGASSAPAAAAAGASSGPTATAAAAWSGPAATAAGAWSGPASVVDDGYRNTAEFLRARLRIGAAEARRRLSLAESLLPREGLAGLPVPPVHRELAAAVAAGEVGSRAATVIAVALDRVRPLCAPDAVARMEHALTRTAAENDADFLVRVTRSWADALDQDGAEPSEELLRQHQGAFIRRRRNGLHHLEIYATTEQFEHLLTVMNTATNPRTGTGGTSPAAGTGDGTAAVEAAEDPAANSATASGEGPAAASASGSGHDSAAGAANGWGAASFTATGWDCAAGGVSACDARPAVSRAADVLAAAESGAHPLSAAHTVPEAPGSAASVSAAHTGPGDDPGAGGLDLRSRPQKLLDGLVGACKLALATGQLPASGGLRPQVMVTIDYRDLLTRLGTTGTGTPEQTGALLFTGPVTASTVRKIACDADIIPVLLGSEGRVLDIGRASRVFPPHLRKALTARDRGCAFPGCTIPAPWCEAHHIDYWSRGGSTGTENGTLLCSHHHHVIHKEHWTIQLKTGIPWFIPPPHLDPRQHPRRNHYFRPTDVMTAA